MKYKITVFVGVTLFTMSCATAGVKNNGTIYKTDENRSRIYRLYDQRLAEWPVPYEVIEMDTRYGRTNIIATGDINNPPLILIHAMGVTATMWFPNVEAWSESFRVYAVNTIGDLGKSELDDMDHYPKNGLNYSEWVSDILDALEIERCDVIGASMGGWIAMNCAIYLPERIDHLVLLGPMGIKANTLGVMIRLFKVLIFPSQKNKETLTKWVLGENKYVNEKMAEYMNTAMNCEGKMAIPKRIPKRHLEKIEAKTLLVLGKKDHPIGNPEKNARFAKKHIKKIDVEIVDTGHLMSMEKPELVNPLILEFLGK